MRYVTIAWGVTYGPLGMPVTTTYAALIVAIYAISTTSRALVRAEAFVERRDGVQDGG